MGPAVRATDGGRGGARNLWLGPKFMGLWTSLSPPLPSSELPSSLRSPPLAPSPSFRSRPLKSSWGRAVSSPSGVCDGAPAEMEFGAF